jgi:hypothetical protein
VRAGLIGGTFFNRPQNVWVAVIDADDHKTEILALCRNVIVAKAAFTAAVEQRAGKRVKLTRGAQVHADSSRGR